MTRVLTVPNQAGTQIARSLGIGASGELYLAGFQKLGFENAQFAVLALNEDGSLNTDFGANGWAITGFVNPLGGALGEAWGEAMAVDTHGRLLVVGTVYNPYSGFFDVALARWTSSGVLDTSFSGDGRQTLDLSQRDDKAQAVAVLADGKILVAGMATDRNGNTNLLLVRLNPDGSLDTSFGSGGSVQTDTGVVDTVQTLLVQPDGKILVAGTGALREGQADWLLARYTSNGALDTSFASLGYCRVDLGQGLEVATGLALQNDPVHGLRILVSGYSVSPQGVSSAAIVRLLANGNMDASFGTNGAVLLASNQGDARAWGVAVQPDDSLVMAGAADGDMALFRLTADGAIDIRVDDGRTLIDFPSGSSEAISDTAYALAIRGDMVVAAGGVWSGSDLDMGVAMLVDNHFPVGKPVISGSLRQYDRLSADASGVSDADGLGAFGWQWLANGAPIVGATGSTLDLTQDQVGKFITVRLSYTDALGNPESVNSLATAAIQNVDDAAIATLALSGSAIEGGQLNLSITGLQDADGSVTTNVVWQFQNGLLWQDLVGRSGVTLNIPSDQSYVGLTVRAKVTTTDVLGGITEFLSPSAQIQNVNDPTVATAVLEGLAQEGGVLTAVARNASDEDGGIVSWSIQWQTVIGGSWGHIADATGNTLSIAADQSMVGRSYRVILTSTDAFGAQAVFVSSPVVIANVNDAPVGSVSISGVATQGQTLRAAQTLTDEDGVGTITYTWKADDVAVSTGSSLLLTQSHVGKAISVTASYTDRQGTLEAISSSATGWIANRNDLPTGQVTITGSPIEGQTLTAGNSLQDLDGIPDSGSGAIVYTWKADNDVLGTGNVLLLTQAHVGKFISLNASYVDAYGSAESVKSAVTAAVANVNDAPTGGVLIGGNATQGQTLTATNTLADADGLGALTYTWTSGEAVLGTGASLLLTQAHVGRAITVSASYTDGFGQAEVARSSATAPVANINDAPTGSVTIAGTAQQGQRLTASHNLQDADGMGPVSWTWMAGEAVLGSGATLDLTQAHVGRAITVSASYTDGFGQVEVVRSSATALVINVNDAPTGSVLIEGTLAQGQTLTAANTLTDVDGMGTVAYTWRAGTEVVGTGASLLLTQAHVGRAITLTARYTDLQGTAEEVASAASTPVANVNDAPTGGVLIGGNVTQGQTLTATHTLADADGLGALTYTWTSGEAVLGTGASLLLTQAHVGRAITVSASYTDGFGQAEAVHSSATAPVANINDAPTGSVTMLGTLAQGQTLTATNTLADADGLGALTYTWTSGEAVLGTGESLMLTQAHVGKAIRVSASYTDLQGTPELVISSASAVVANVNDAPTGGVMLLGALVQGQTLQVQDTVQDADGLGTPSHVWQRRSDEQADWQDMSDVVGTTHVLTQADVGHQLRVLVRYTDGQGTNEEVVSAPTQPVANVNDGPTGSVLIEGTLAQGQTLTATNTLADVDGMGTAVYTWRAGAEVLGTGASLLLTQAHVGRAITVSASYTDLQGTAEEVASAASMSVANVNDAPTGSVLIEGTLAQGQTLTAANTLTDVDGMGTVAYTWRAGTEVVGTGASLLLTQAHVGRAITLTARYTDLQGTAEEVASAASTPVVNVNDAPTGGVLIGGNATQGQTLTATNTLADADGLGAVTYTWTSGEAVLGTGASLLLTQAHVGRAITVSASYTDGFGQAEAVHSSATAPVANVNDAPTGSVTMLGTLAQGQTLTATNTLADADGLGALTYTWTSGEAVLGTGESLMLTQAHVGKAIRVSASYTDLQGTPELVISSASAVVANVNDAPTGGVMLLGALVQGQTLQVQDTVQDADGLGTPSHVWQRRSDEQADWQDMSDVVGTTHVLTQADVGHQLRVLVRYTDGQGTNEEVVSAPTQPVANVNDGPTGSVLIEGTLAQGQTLTATNTLADVDGMGTAVYTWRAGAEVLGTGASLLLTQAHVGRAITVSASYTDLQGTAEEVASAASMSVANVNDAPTGSVLIEGTLAQGQTLTAANTLTDVDGMGTVAYTWRAGTEVVGTGASLLLTQAHVGRAITLTARYTDLQGTAEEVASAASTPVVNVNDAPTGGVLIGGNATQGQTLTATHTLADADGLGAVTYTWTSGEAVLGTGASLLLTQAHVGRAITVSASYTDGFGQGEAVHSSATSLVANVNDVPTGSVTVSGSVSREQWLGLTLQLDDADGLGPLAIQWQRNTQADGQGAWQDVPNGTDSRYQLQVADVGVPMRVSVRYTDGQGTPEQVFSAPTLPVTPYNNLPVGLPRWSGEALQGQTLQAERSLVSDADGMPALVQWQWQREVGPNADQWQTVLGATEGAYLLSQADVGLRLRLVLQYVDTVGTLEQVISMPTAPVVNVNDGPTGSVLIGGPLAQGQTLTASHTLADADGLGALTYTWTSGEAVLGTGASLLLTQAHVGRAIVVSASYTDGFGQAEVVRSSATAPVANVNDAPTGSVLIEGTLAQGQTLTAANTLADVDGMGTVVYTWRAGTEVVGTGASLLLTQAHVGRAITLTARYTDLQGTAEEVASAASTPVANVNDAPTGGVLIGGNPTQGQTLTATNTLADADGLGALTYTWTSGEAVLGTGQSLLLTQAHVGRAITVSASYTDGFGQAEVVRSSATAPVANINDAPTGSVTIAGTAQQGQRLTASHNLQDADGMGPVSWTWMAGEAVLGSGATLDLTQAHVGRAIRVLARYTDALGMAETVSSGVTSAVINVNDAPTGSVLIEGTLAQGQTLTAANTLADVDGMGTVSYTWRAGTEVVGTGASLLLTQAHVGRAITLTARYTDLQGTAEEVASAASTPVANVNDAPTGGVLIGGNATQGQTLTATNTLADADGLGAVTYTWTSGEAVLGTGASLLLTQAHVGQAIVVSASYNDGFGQGEAVNSSATAPVANVNDAPTGSVLIEGTLAQGQTLTAANTLADVDGMGTVVYTWRAGTEVVGTGASLLLTQAHVGKAIRVSARYTDLQGTAEEVASAASTPVANVNDAPTGGVLIGGNATQGQTLTATHTLADADGLGALTYTWTSGEAVLGTGASLLLTQAHVGRAITVSARYTDGFGQQEEVISTATALVANVNDAPTGSVTIAGTAQQGQRLTASHNLQDADGMGPVSWTWMAGEAVLGSGATLDLTQAHVGRAITVSASYTDGFGQVEVVRSSATALVINVNDAPSGSVLIEGTLAQGQTLTAANTLADADGMAASGAGALAYTWRAGTEVVGTGASLLLTQAHVGKAIRLSASYTDLQGTAEEVASAASTPVANVNDAPTGGVLIGGNATQGQTLTATNTLADADGLGAVTYTWTSGEVVLGTGASLLLTQAHVGRAITVSASYTDGFGQAEVVHSSATAPVVNVNDAPQLAQPLPDVRAQASAAFVLVLPAGQFTDPDGDGLQRQVLQADGSALPAWLVWDAETQSMRMAAGQGVAGEYALKVVAGDGSLSASDPFVLTLTPDAFAVSGLVQDGYVAGARIYVDRNGDGVAQDSEDTGLVTDSQGRFAGQISGLGPLIALGGTNLDTGLRNLMPLRAPEGAGVISPVTTLVQAMVDQGQGLEAAQQRVLQVFGLRSGLNLLQFDPLADSAPLSDALSVQKLNVQVALAVSTVSQVAGGAQALTQSLAQAVVADPDARLDLGDGGVLQQVLSAALAPTQVSSAVAQLQGAFEQVAQSQSLGQVAQSQQAALLDIAQQHQIDLAAPLLQSSSPGMGSREVLPGANWVLTYNEAIGLGSGAIEVIDVRTASVLRSVSVGDPTQVQVSGSTLTLNLSSDLAVGTTYALRLPAGAVQDLAGNAAASARGLFTTAGVSGGINGSAGNDHLVGTAGADRLQPGLGSDTVDGGLGQDTVVLPLYANAYKNWQAIEGGYRVEVNTGHTLTLKGIETIELGNDYVSSIPVARFVSGEAQDQLEKLTDLYLAFYGRAPDVGGLAYWQERNLEEGRDFRLISQDFAWARETERLFPQGASNEAFITAIYQNCFNRAPDPAGLAYWAEVLQERLAAADPADGGADRNIRGDFVCELILGAYAVTSGPEDQGLLTNKHEVALDYVSRLSGQTVLDFENEAINALLATVTLQASTREAALDALAHVFDERPYDAQVSLTGVMNNAGLLAQLGLT